MRFHLIDRIEEIHYGKYITAVKCITLSDDVFNEHFPGYPVYPGSLIMEGLAQLSGSFFEIMMKEKGILYKRSILIIVNKLKFRKPAEPGDKLFYHSEILSMQDDFGVAKVKAEIDGEIYAEGELTFSFVTIDSEKLKDSRFEMYDICTKHTRIIKDEC